MLPFLRNISPTEIIIIASILLLLFGSKFVTRIARSAGESLREIKKIKKSFTEAMDDEPNEVKGGVS